MCDICRQIVCPGACPNADVRAMGICPICRQRIYRHEPSACVDGEDYHTECLENLGTRGLLVYFGHDFADWDEAD